MGSLAFGEEITASKYPEYEEYRKRVSKFIPGRKYDEEEKYADLDIGNC